MRSESLRSRFSVLPSYPTTRGPNGPLPQNQNRDPAGRFTRRPTARRAPAVPQSEDAAAMAYINDFVRNIGVNMPE